MTDEHFERLPNFFILGAAKAGTTTLTDLLRQHPRVFLPFDKEPMFFSRDSFYARGLPWYTRTYFGEAAGYPARGEASPHYLYWSQKTAPRLREACAGRDARFIVIFREPAARAYSWYWNMIKEGREDLPFEQALAQESQRLTANAAALRDDGSMLYGYARGGLYAQQLEPFLSCFPRERFLFLLYSELERDPQTLAGRVLAFLGLDAPFESLTLSHSNPAAMPRNRRLQTALQGPSGLKELVKRVVPLRWRYLVKSAALRANSRAAQYPPMQPDTAARLRAAFAEENRRLEALTGLDLSDWGQA